MTAHCGNLTVLFYYLYLRGKIPFYKPIFVTKLRVP